MAKPLKQSQDTPHRRTISRLPAVLARTGLSRAGLYRAVAAGTFPRQVKLGDRAAGWFDDEVDQWINSRAANREARP